MNKQEKKALWSFVTIYTFSSMLLMSIIALLYYNKEIESQKQACKQDLQSTIIKVEMNLLKAELDDKKFVINPEHYSLQVALYDKDKKLIISNLHFQDIDLQKKMSMKKSRVQLVKKLEKPIQDIQYILAEDSSVPIGIEQLKYLIYLTMFIASIFIAFIGYFLSKLLLKPINEKVQQIDKFIKDSAHEINTPVTALLMSVSRLKKKGVADDKLLKHISSSSKQISEVYNALSHIAFNDIKNRAKRVKFDLKKEVIKSISFYQEIADAKGITINTDLKSTYIKMDKNSSHKLINNLLSNAIKYSYYGKEISVTLKNNTLSVTDKGIGITEENQKLILKRYKRATNQVGGFGIGLDIVNSICKEYNLKLSMNSTPKIGSKFTLDLSNIVLLK